MARDNNFLLGRGEELTHKVPVRSGGGSKNPPYTFAGARERLTPRLKRATKAFDDLPAAARPNDQVVAVVTMHPRYISKSDFPTRLFDSLGLTPVGSRVRKIKPDRWGIKDPPEEALTNDIFVAGSRASFGGWAQSLSHVLEDVQWAEDFTHIEDVSAFGADTKLRPDPAMPSAEVYEIVLHNTHSEWVVPRFISYARSLRAEPLERWRRDVGGLSFLPVRVSAPLVRALAEFSFVRVARPMPRLRILRPDIVRLAAAAAVELPDEPPLDMETRVVVFDGGMPPGLDLSRWVNLIEPWGIGEPSSDYQEHGLAVTSAILFGNLASRGPIQRPLCQVDHVRVLEAESTEMDLEYPEVLDRITDHLKRNPNHYHFVNLSLGPRLPITDDEVTQWTARLDEFLAPGTCLATVAAGNDGELEAAYGLNRIQPPADAVNALSVGACDSPYDNWRRASYSCIGPGRAPGLVKPDGVAFGGTREFPYMVLGSLPAPCTVGVSGTSIAAPHALRSGIAVRAQLGSELSPLAIRALLIHCADESSDLEKIEVGWGRFKDDYSSLITCEDSETLVVYQGSLPLDHHLRAPIPLPKKPMTGMVEIAATILISTEVDPEHAGAYTRSGVLVSFRPHAQKFRSYPDGRISEHPVTEGFFSASNMYAAAEYDLQEQGQKWEPCIRARRRKRAASLYRPCFDIDYQHRDGTGQTSALKPIRYVLIVSVRAPKVPDLYNQVVRDYANILVPIRPRLRIPIRTKG